MDRFTHNSEDTIYHQASENSLRFAFLVVSEFFDTPSDGVTKTLQFVTDKLNESEADKGERKDALNLYLQRAHLQATNMRGDAIHNGDRKGRWFAEGQRDAIEAMLKEVNK